MRAFTLLGTTLLLGICLAQATDGGSDGPVCGTNNTTYSNAAAAGKAGVAVAYHEACVDCRDPSSSFNINIVCGAKNILYPNPYAAICIFKDRVAKEGKCVEV